VIIMTRSERNLLFTKRLGLIFGFLLTVIGVAIILLLFEERTRRRLPTGMKQTTVATGSALATCLPKWVLSANPLTGAELEAHARLVLERTRPFRTNITVHKWYGQGGPWIENRWISHFCCQQPLLGRMV
jgi:hypothetical protein